MAVCVQFTACSLREAAVSHRVDCKAEITWIDHFSVSLDESPSCRTRERRLPSPGTGNCIGLIRFLPLLVFFLFLPTSSWAVDPATHISQYRHTAWRMKDGLLRGEPNDITQTPDGYIWIGTTAGLMQFDGVRLAPWKPPTEVNCPLQLLELC